MDDSVDLNYLFDLHFEDEDTTDIEDVLEADPVYEVGANGEVNVEEREAPQLLPEVEVEDPDGDLELLKDYIQKGKSKNTVKVTKSHVKKFRTWLSAEKKEYRAPELIEPERLNLLLGLWLMSLKKNEESYEPRTLIGFHRSVARYSKEKDYEVDIIQDRRFETTSAVLRTKQSEAKSSGKGNNIKATQEISKEDEEKLWSQGVLGDHSAESLLNTVWFFNGLLLCYRGNDEHSQLKFGDLTLHTEGEGSSESGSCIVYNERSTKTRKGNKRGRERAFTPKLWPDTENPDRCPIRFYKKYCDLRPESTKNEDADFYLRPLKKAAEKTWYEERGLGINKLQSMMSRMSVAAKTSVRYTNHALRKTGISRLAHCGVDHTLIAQFSGHKNVNSINNYMVASIDQQKEFASIMMHGKRTNGKENMNLAIEGSEKLAIEGPLDLGSGSELDISQYLSPPILTQYGPSSQTPNVLLEVQANVNGMATTSGLFAGANIYNATFNIIHKN